LAEGEAPMKASTEQELRQQCFAESSVADEVWALVDSLKEALESIAARHLVEGGKKSFWLNNKTHADVAAVAAMDTRIARQALK
jgi:hypothetical protein